MSDLLPSNDSDAGNSSLDTSVIPLGERALRGLLGHVVAVGDEAETTYLEVKSPLDMNSKAAAAKIAKFLLGAANRRPREAAQYFHGYAVLVIGVQRDSATGVLRGTEAHELEDRLRPYLGPQFPAFEFGRIGIDSDREVLFVIAQPPQDGQAIFPCHKSYQSDDRRDSLEDGAIYVRGTSNTRPARSGEVLALVERVRRGGRPPIDLEVQVIGPICRVDRVDEVLESLRCYEEEQFSMQSTPAEDTSRSALLVLPSSIFGNQKPLSMEDRETALAAWRSKKAEHIAKGREHLLGVGVPGAGVQVVSRDRFVSKPHLALTFHNCEVLDCLDPEDADIEKVMEPVLGPHVPFLANFDHSAIRPVLRNYPVTWSNHGSDAQVVLTPEAFRPNVVWASDQDDYVLIARDLQASAVEVSWELTEDGSDTVTRGEVRVPTGRCTDAADVIKSVLVDVDEDLS
ncbi:hypothetical protein ACFV2E_09835 [Streptomyces globisporus]|uniref:hypothetical protein n=1 Tax=Streptomyces globisporus TaxID=1908 RepID=UPI0036CBBDC2